jgi:hypothetical protein
MKVSEELIDQILEQGENGSLDPSPYMESLKYLLMEDEEVELTEEDHAYLIFHPRKSQPHRSPQRDPG